MEEKAFCRVFYAFSSREWADTLTCPRSFRLRCEMSSENGLLKGKLILHLISSPRQYWCLYSPQSTCRLSSSAFSRLIQYFSVYYCSPHWIKVLCSTQIPGPHRTLLLWPETYFEKTRSLSPFYCPRGRERIVIGLSHHALRISLVASISVSHSGRSGSWWYRRGGCSKQKKPGVVHSQKWTERPTAHYFWSLSRKLHKNPDPPLKGN